MSSIYRKGRGGYFYYQAYIFNPETGKNDKRIFHSLGTKNEYEAERKKIKLDNNYENKKSNIERLPYNIHYKLFIFIFIIFGTLFVFFKDEYQIFSIVSRNRDEVDVSLKNKKKMNSINGDFLGQNTVAQVFYSTTENYLTFEESRTHTKNKKIEQLDSIPNFTLVRIDQLSGVFEQGKLYITINENTSYKSMKMLCNMLKNEHTEFENIIICIYAENTIEKAIFEGDGGLISNNEYNKAWLAMYSYNKVEGEYFDGNPGKYLGIN